MKLLLFIFSIAIFSESALALPKTERQELFNGATKRLKDSGIEARAPKAGDRFPDLVIQNRSVHKRLQDGMLLFIVYRGGWCPFCVGQLKEIEKRLTELNNHNVQVIAISPETSTELAKTKRKSNLSMELVSDLNYKLLRKLNLVFKVEEKVLQEYKSIGLDLAQSQGNENGELPVPATYLIDQKGRIIYSFVDADYSKRANLDDVFTKIKSLK